MPEYHFICECFFMTAKSLHLGVVKLVNDMQGIGREIQHYQREKEEYEAELSDQQPGSRRESELRRIVSQYKSVLDKCKAYSFTYQGVLSDPDLMAEVLAFYR